VDKAGLDRQQSTKIDFGGQMAESPVFFLPGVKPNDEEKFYAQCAEACGCAVPSADKRIYSISFTHDSEEWTATVGEELRGISRKTVRRRGQRVEQTTSRSDPATVVAIFASAPYQVVTNGYRTRWANPFYVGKPNSVTYFSADKTRDAIG
jgi:hypothetical protein